MTKPETEKDRRAIAGAGYEECSDPERDFFTFRLKNRK